MKGSGGKRGGMTMGGVGKRDKGKKGESETQQGKGHDSSTRGGISRRARIARASSTDTRAYVAPLSRIPRSSNRRRRRTSARSSRADLGIIQTSPLAIGRVRVGLARARVSVAVNASEEDV